MVVAARRLGIRVVGELEIGWRLLANEFVAITGSNGKTTTTELIGHIHREAGAAVVVAGNVGTALTTLPGTIDRSAVVVCEASSFQLEDTEAFAPDAAVLLNLAEDHLDRYRTVDAYREAKLQAFARQPAGALAVAPAALVGRARRCRRARDLRPRRRRRAARRPPAAGAGSRSWAPARSACAARTTSTTRWRRPPCASPAGSPSAPCAPRWRASRACRTGSRRSPPSRASSTSTTRRRPTSRRRWSASSRSPGGVHAILGGRGKRSDFTPLAAPLAERARAAYLIGEAAPQIGAALAGCRRAAARVRRPRRGARSGTRRRAARRRRAALAGLRLLRPVPVVRGARRPLPDARRRGIAAGVEARSDGHIRAREEAAATRAPAPADGDLLSARGRCGDGLLGLVGADAARRARATAPPTWSSTSPTAPSASWSCTCSRATGSSRRGAGPALILLAAAVMLVLVLIPGIGVEVNGARRWLGAGVLDVPAVGGDEARARAARRRRGRRASEARAQPARRSRPGAGGRRRVRAADPRPARPRHRPGHLLHAGRDARGGRSAAAPARPHRRRGRGPGPALRADGRRADVAADRRSSTRGRTRRTPASSRSRARSRSAPAGCSGSAPGSPCRRSSTCPRRTPTSSSP